MLICNKRHSPKCPWKPLFFTHRTDYVSKYLLDLPSPLVMGGLSEVFLDFWQEENNCYLAYDLKNTPLL